MKRNMQWMAGVVLFGMMACGGGGGDPVLPDVQPDVVETVTPDVVEVAVDTTAPTAPSQLTVEAKGLTAVKLTWVGSTDEVGVTGYKVFDKGSEIGTVATTTFNHEGLVVDVEHCYRVRAFDLAGNVSDQSNEACITLTTTPVPPTISGTIQYAGTQTGTIVVLISQLSWYETQSKEDFVLGATLLAPGPYTSIELDDGTYYLISVMLTTNPSESKILSTDPWAAYESFTNPTAVVIVDGKAVTGVDMTLVDGTTESPNPFGKNEEEEELAQVWSHHWSGGYDVVLSWKDPDPEVAMSVSVSGPGIDSSTNLSYDSNSATWNTWTQPSQNVSIPDPSLISLPALYTFTIVDGSGDITTDAATLDCFMTDFATNLSPSGNINTETPTFSWEKVAQSEVFYQVQLNSSGFRVWNSVEQKDISSVVYNGAALQHNVQYSWDLVATPADPEHPIYQGNCASFAQQTFTHITP